MFFSNTPECSAVVSPFWHAPNKSNDEITAMGNFEEMIFFMFFDFNIPNIEIKTVYY
jgi:hypothetical protein